MYVCMYVFMYICIYSISLFEQNVTQGQILSRV